jgi:hypothetical protein
MRAPSALGGSTLTLARRHQQQRQRARSSITHHTGDQSDLERGFNHSHLQRKHKQCHQSANHWRQFQFFDHRHHQRHGRSHQDRPGTNYLSGANTYSGLTTSVSAGVLNLQNNSALGIAGSDDRAVRSCSLQGGISRGGQFIDPQWHRHCQQRRAAQRQRQQFVERNHHARGGFHH